MPGLADVGLLFAPLRFAHGGVQRAVRVEAIADPREGLQDARLRVTKTGIARRYTPRPRRG